jgi:hypothetical protein
MSESRRAEIERLRREVRELEEERELEELRERLRRLRNRRFSPWDDVIPYPCPRRPLVRWGDSR